MTSERETYLDAVRRHYVRAWRRAPRICHWKQGPWDQLPKGFSVLEFPPGSGRELWTYATCGMSAESCDTALELHIFSPVPTESLVELLTVVAHFHCFGANLGVGHTVNFGRPWLEGSQCTFGLISLPYLDGPDLEVMRVESNAADLRFLWLVPVTPSEVEFKKKNGLDALEELFEERGFDYADPLRMDVTASSTSSS